jgi:transposase
MLLMHIVGEQSTNQPPHRQRAAGSFIGACYIHSVHDAEERIARLTTQIEDLVPAWSAAPVVEAFQAMRGMAFVAAVAVVAEAGDFRRFDNPRQVMAGPDRM